MTHKNTTEKIFVILNPKAGAGKAGRNVAQIEALLDQSFENWSLQPTQGPKHASELAREACEKDFDIVAAVGGDGTCHEVINGLMLDDKPRKSDIIFTLLPFGTGSDFMKSLYYPKDLSQALQVAAFGQTRTCDIGKCILHHAEKTQTRYFINVAGMGINGEVARISNQSSKRLGGKISFFSATIQAMLRHNPATVRFRWQHADKEEIWEGELLAGFVANGMYCGGGMQVAPQAELHNRKLDLTLLQPRSFTRQVWEMRNLYNGQIATIDGAICKRMETVYATTNSGSHVLIELDGELSGQLPATFSVLPQILKIRGNWPKN